MCGACGRTVIADPVLGSTRATRDLLLVAHVVNAVTAGLPGAPAVRVAGDRWLVAGSTGRTSACDTVRDLWRAMVDHYGRGAACSLADRLARNLPGASPLADRVLREGMAAADDTRSGAVVS